MADLYRSDICKVDISKSLVRSYAGIVLATGDKNANRFGAIMYRGNDPVNLTGQGVAVMGYFIRPNAETVVVTGTVDGNTVYVDLPEACYTASGSFSLAIKVSSTDITQTVRVIDGCIRLTQTDTLVDPGEVVPSLDDLFAHIAEMEAATTAAQEAAADAMAAAADAERVANDTATSILVDMSGGVASVADAAARDAVGVVSTITAVQGGSGAPSPDNVRAISGWDAATLTRTGRNLVSHQDYLIARGNKATIITDDMIDVTDTTPYDYAHIPVHLKAGVTYTLHVQMEVYGRDESSTDPSYSRIGLIKSGDTIGSRKITANGVYNIIDTYTSDTDTDGRVQLYVNYGNDPSVGSVQICARLRVMLVEGEYTLDTMPPFEPCTQQRLTAALPETVYGGTLDWTTGLLTVTHKQQTLNGTEGWYNRAGATKALDISDLMPVAAHSIAGNVMADTLVTVSPIGMLNDMTPYSICVQADAARINVRLSGDEADTAAFTAALAANPVNIVYRLASPYTLQLDPQTLDMLKGYNALWSDTGDTAVTYVADTKLYIDNKFNVLQSAILAQGANI